MDFGNIRKKSVKVGKDRVFKKVSDAFRKRPVHFDSGRHHDGRCRNAPGVFRKASETFLDFRSLPSSHGNCRITCRHRKTFFEVHYTPFTLNQTKVYQAN